MSRRVFVSLVPSLIDASRLPGSNAVVIDVLRASTTICAALASGVTRIVPTGTVEDAKRLAEQLAQGGERPLLGGERGGVKIDGFDLGNSPLEYMPWAVGGQSLVFTTTNGTRALISAIGAGRIYVGAFANLDALADRLAADTNDVHLMCAGTDTQVTLEDVLCAGEFVAALSVRLPRLEFGNDEAAIALELRRGATEESTRLEALRSSLGGRNLIELGSDADIEFSAKIGTARVVPVYDDGVIVVEAEGQGSDEVEWAI